MWLRDQGLWRFSLGIQGCFRDRRRNSGFQGLLQGSRFLVSRFKRTPLPPAKPVSPKPESVKPQTQHP